MRYLLTFFSVCIALTGMAQPQPTPTAPSQLQFANLTVRFDADARRIVQQDINALMSNRQYWNAKLDRALLYFPIIEATLLGDEIPTDFKYLALQESSLTPDAVSSSQAVGFWQFKRETASDYGLTVNDEVDERKNISASTRGAARYLRRSHGMYTNWVSALYSFYLGTGGISKIVSPDWANASDITLNGQTDRYILRFFAHKLAVEHSIRTYQPVTTFSLVEYTGGGGKTVNEIAGELGLNAGDIRTYNRWLLIDHVPADKPYVLVVPTPNGQINDLRQRIAQTTNTPLKAVVTDDIGFPVLKRVTQTANAGEAVLYEINGLPGIQAQAGDNAGTLARKAKTSLSSFLRYNDLGERDPLVAGEVYYLTKKRSKALVPFHTARTDETMRGISQRYGLRLKKLVRYNRMDRVQKLQAGRVLWLRERRPARVPIEIITAPTPPVYDNSPATPSNRPVTERPGRDVDVAAQTGSSIPRNASERRRYQPKLVGSATPTPQSGRGTADVPAPTSPAPPQTAATVPVNRPEPDATVPNRQAGRPESNSDGTAAAPPTPTVTTTTTARPGQPDVETVVAPRDAGSPQRTIIVRSEGEPVRERTTPSRTGPGTYPETPDPVAESVPARPTPRQTQPVDRTPLPRNQTATLPPLPPMTAPDATTKGRSARHVVEAGQTYYSLARYYGITVDQLMAPNNLTAADRLSVGQILLVEGIPSGYPSGQPTSPMVGTSVEPVPASGSPLPPTMPAPPAEPPAFHTVAKGETLYRISKQYNVTIEQLMQWNRLTEPGVKEGQKLKLSE